VCVFLAFLEYILHGTDVSVVCRVKNIAQFRGRGCFCYHFAQPVLLATGVLVSVPRSVSTWPQLLLFQVLEHPPSWSQDLFFSLIGPISVATCNYRATGDPPDRSYAPDRAFMHTALHDP